MSEKGYYKVISPTERLCVKTESSIVKGSKGIRFTLVRKFINSSSESEKVISEICLTIREIKKVGNKTKIIEDLMEFREIKA
jgi:Trp operon repressor